MVTKKQHYTVRQLVDAWESAQLRRNPEYQRGAAWSLSQKQAFVDSAFRAYPLPPLFLEKKVTTGALDGGTSAKFEVVDGQQRLIALDDYYGGTYPLLAPDDRKLRLPASLRSLPAAD